MQAENTLLQIGRRWNWDKIGIGLSTLCMIHCLATTFILLLVPAFGAQFLDNSEQFHWLMAIVVLPVALFAFLRGYTHHHRVFTLALGFSGVGLLYTALIFHEVFESSLPHVLVTIAGSALLLTAHVLNWRYCRQCDHAH